ncbi:hypothetical protein FQR65_LT01874 [Abscondita terminalis]|nr:hypothetical protein FQR65_LT01874 [Abscondita terminalis]
MCRIWLLIFLSGICAYPMQPCINYCPPYVKCCSNNQLIKCCPPPPKLCCNNCVRSHSNSNVCIQETVKQTIHNIETEPVQECENCTPDPLPEKMVTPIIQKTERTQCCNQECTFCPQQQQQQSMFYQEQPTFNQQPPVYQQQPPFYQQQPPVYQQPINYQQQPMFQQTFPRYLTSQIVCHPICFANVQCYAKLPVQSVDDHNLKMDCLKYLALIFVVSNFANANWYSGEKRCRNRCAKRGPPYCTRWCVYTIFHGCCVQSKYVCCSYREKPGFCPASKLFCVRPYSYYFSRSYKCMHDFNCPWGYKCCADDCFRHKICKPIWNGINKETTTTIIPTTTGEPRTTTIELLTTTDEPTTTPVSSPSTISILRTTSEPTTTTIESVTITDEPTTTATSPSPTTANIPTTTSEPATTTTASVTTTDEPTTTTPLPSPTTANTPTTTQSTIITTLNIDENTIGPVTEELEGSGIPGIIEPNAELVNGFIDDEDFNQ